MVHFSLLVSLATCFHEGREKSFLPEKRNLHIEKTPKVKKLMKKPKDYENLRGG